MPAVGVLDEPRAVEPVSRCAAPDVRGAQGVEPAADAPLGGELLRRGIRGEAQRDAGEGVRPERAVAAERLQLVAQPVEGAAAAQRIVEEHLRPEAVRERPAPAGAGAEFVAVGAVTVVPAAAVELPVAFFFFKQKTAYEI